jgi:hypothetical protein
MIRTLISLSSVALCLSATTGALAEQAETHDGLYLRLAGGLTHAIDPAEVDAPGFRAEGTLSGTGVTFDIALGGSPMPGLVLGGAAFLHHVPELEADDMEGTVGGVFDLEGDVTFDGQTFTLLAPFVDYYPNPREGFHLLGAVGFGVLSMEEGTPDNANSALFQDHGATGPAGLVGVGYEWWLADRWSLGVLGRVTYAAPSGDDDDQTEWQHHLWLPALLCTVTFH